MPTIFCAKAIIKDKTDVIGGALQQQVGTIAIVLLLGKISKKQIHLKSGTRAVLQADSELTLKVGGHFIKIDAAGVHVVDSAINLTPFFSPGGSPDIGVGFSGELAKRRRFQRLKNTYVDGRYSEHYVITLEELHYFAAEVKKRQGITEITCQQKIREYHTKG